MRRVRGWLSLVLVVLAGLAAGGALRRPPPPQEPPEVAVRAAVRRFCRAVETGNITAALDVVSDDFRGQRQTKTSIAEVLGAMRRDFRWIDIFIDRIEVDVKADGRRAEVTVYGAFAGLALGNTFEYGQDELVRVHAIFVNERGTWRAISCRDLPFIYGFRY